MPTFETPYGTVDAPDLGAAQKWIGKQKAAAPAPAAPKQENGGLFERLWSGMTGNDASRAGKVGMGMADPAVGMMQLGSRAPVMQDAMPFMPEEMKKAAEPDTKAVDTAVQQREQRYTESRTKAGDKPSGGLFDDMWRMLGNVASPVNLAAGGATGAAMRTAGTVGKLGASAVLGAVTGASEPVTKGNFGVEKAKQIGLGGVAGVAGGALGELTSSTLGNAIAGNNTAAVDRYLTGQFRSSVRPRQLSGSAIGSPQLKMQDNRILTAVDTMSNMAKAGQLSLTDEAGNLLPAGTLPRTLRQFSEGLDNAKGRVFQEYDQMAHATGQQGVQIGLVPFVNQLKEIAADKVTKDTAPAVAKDALKLADTFEARLFYTPSEMQHAISLLNREVTKDIRATGFSPIKPIVDNMRQAIDNTIATLEGPGYQALKTQYGALRSIEKDVANAAQKEARTKPWGSSLANFASAEELMRGVWHMDPKAIGTAAAIQGAKIYMRWLNNPNRAIAKLFQQRANPPGALRRGAGATLEYSYAPGAIAGEKAQKKVSEGLDVTAPAGVR